MALQKDRLYKNGQLGNITVSYWKIGQISINTATDEVYVKLEGYLDKQTRDSGKEPISIINLQFLDGKLKGIGNNLIAQIYTDIKQDYAEDWGDALDV